MSMSAKQIAHNQIITHLMIALKRRNALNDADIRAISASAKEIYNPTNKDTKPIEDEIDSIIDHVNAED